MRSLRDPTGAVSRRVVALLAAAPVLGVLVSACAKADDEIVLDPVVLAMTETTPPLYDDGETKIFQVEKEVPLPFRRFTDEERPKGEAPPYNRPAFHVASNSRITVRFTLTNLDAVKHNVELLIDPWNEFVRYEPGVTMVRDQEVQPNFSGIQHLFVIEGRSRIEGIITPDDMVELATDLTTAMSLKKSPPDAMGQFGGAALYNRAFNQQNRSSEPDPVLAPYLPGAKSTVAAITGFDLGLRMGEPAKVSVEIVTDIQDLAPEPDRVVIVGDEGKALNRPGEVLTPPVAAAAQ